MSDFMAGYCSGAGTVLALLVIITDLTRGPTLVTLGLGCVAVILTTASLVRLLKREARL